ncbi:MAG: DnaJ domain-containing protein [Bacteroidales bacterium]|jgi:DnaJ like chaperone protein|nr:DnaJ domain-containing protein [Bacteroidales bacterium]
MCLFKIILLFAGYVIAGLQGALIGLFAGWILDKVFFPNKVKFASKNHYAKENFVQILLILTSAVVKSSKERMVKSELYFVKDYLRRNLSEEDAQQALYLFRDIMIMDREYDIEKLCRNVGDKASVSEKLFILQFLMGLSGADGYYHEQELEMILNINHWLGLSYATYESVRVMFMGNRQQWAGGNSYSGNYSGTASNTYSNLDNDYKILEVSPDVSDAELKKAYRKVAMKHHPDKVSHLGEEIRKTAEEKFTKVNQAYEHIKKVRGIV